MTQPAGPIDVPVATTTPRPHYRGVVYDSARWDGFAFRPDDIVISTPPKCGTTWLQMICALLVFGTPDLPERLTKISPGVDLCALPIEEVRAELDAQTHRRIIKTHIPLDGLPPSPGVTFIVVGRDPRDVAVSMDHFLANLNPPVVEKALRAAGALDAGPAAEAGAAAPRPDDQRTRVLHWLFCEDPPETNLHTLRGTVRHLAGAWDRRHDPDTVLLHYNDLSRDLDGRMRWLAERLGIAVRPGNWAELVAAAGFQRMKENAGKLVPDSGLDLFTDNQRFFRSGTSGQWRDVLTEEDVARYGRLVAELAPPDLARWLHHGAGD